MPKNIVQLYGFIIACFYFGIEVLTPLVGLSCQGTGERITVAAILALVAIPAAHDEMSNTKKLLSSTLFSFMLASLAISFLPPNYASQLTVPITINASLVLILSLGLGLYGMANLLNFREHVPAYMLDHQFKPAILLFLTIPIFFLGLEFVTPLIGLSCNNIIGRLSLSCFFAGLTAFVYLALDNNFLFKNRGNGIEPFMESIPVILAAVYTLSVAFLIRLHLSHSTAISVSWLAAIIAPVLLALWLIFCLLTMCGYFRVREQLEI